MHREAPDSIPLEETLQVLGDLVTQGKIRHVGVSNETSWGVMKALHHSETAKLPRVQSVQNAYNLLNRLYEQGLAEISAREGVSLLAYSPLGGGALSCPLAAVSSCSPDSPVDIRARRWNRRSGNISAWPRIMD